MSFISVSLLDGSAKTLSVDAEATCEEVIDMICERLELEQDVADFRLFILEKGQETMLPIDSCPQPILKNMGATFPPKPADPKLIFKRVYWMSPRDEEYTDPALIELMVSQAQHHIHHGIWGVTIEQAVELGGILMACRYGEPTAAHTASFLSPMLSQFVPVNLMSKLKPKVWETQIIKAYKDCVGVTAEEAQKKYLKYVRDNVLSYGSMQYPASYLRCGEQRLKSVVVIGINAVGLTISRASDLKVEAYFPYEKIKSWKAKNPDLLLMTGEVEDAEGILHHFTTPYGEEIVQVMIEYIERTLAMRRAG